MKDTRFKPCPFCGGDDFGFLDRESAIRVRLHRRAHGEKWNGYVVTVWCQDCGANIAYFAKPTETSRAAERKLIEAWNRRAV